jgi:hypothetical protein
MFLGFAHYLTLKEQAIFSISASSSVSVRVPTRANLEDGIKKIHCVAGPVSHFWSPTQPRLLLGKSDSAYFRVPPYFGVTVVFAGAVVAAGACVVDAAGADVVAAGGVEVAHSPSNRAKTTVIKTAKDMNFPILFPPIK